MDYDPKQWETTRHVLSALTSRCFAKGAAVGSEQAALTAKVLGMAEALLEEVTPQQVATYTKGCKVVVTDIEGTTTPIPFVTTVLFPFAEKRFAGYVKDNFASLSGIVSALRKQAVDDNAATPPIEAPLVRETGSDEDIIADVVANLLYNSKANRKVTPLKELQGMIWKEGYASGALVSQVFPDVPVAFKRWTANGTRVYIYSSGSVGAQKLLFSGCPTGNLLPHLSGHFDTTTGHKQEAASYRAIAKEVGEPADEILFLTDIVAEAVAARDAGMKALLLLRPENHLYSQQDQPLAASFLQILSFDDIFPDAADTPSKRRRTE